MKHRKRHAGGCHRHHMFSPEGAERGHGRHHRHHHGRGHGGSHREGRARLFDYGEIRLLTLSLIAEKPTYGYELIKTIEEASGGSYTPSPGVIYPTLTWLEEAGYIHPTTDEGRKNYGITPEGVAFLTANQAALEEIRSRSGSDEHGRRRDLSTPLMRAMKNLKTALRLRLRDGGLDIEAEQKIIALLDEAAQTISQA